jgi:hypothetical protein
VYYKQSTIFVSSRLHLTLIVATFFVLQRDVNMSMQPQAVSMNMNAVPTATASNALPMNTATVNSAASGGPSPVAAASLPTVGQPQIASESQVLDRKRYDVNRTTPFCSCMCFHGVCSIYLRVNRPINVIQKPTDIFLIFMLNNKNVFNYC